MISGETVIVRTFTDGEPDPFGNAERVATDEEVRGVLVQVGATTDVVASNRPEGVLVKFTLHFPKTYNKRLKGAHVCVRGEWLEVVGDPAWHTPENCPTAWNYSVEVSAVNG